MTETIDTEFCPRDLPRWAQRYDEIVWLCERDLGFRVNVHEADSRSYKMVLLRQARKLYASAFGMRQSDF